MAARQLIHWRVDGEVVEVVDRGLYALRLETLTRELRLLCVVNMALTAETTNDSNNTQAHF